MVIATLYDNGIASRYFTAPKGGSRWVGALHPPFRVENLVDYIGNH